MTIKLTRTEQLILQYFCHIHEPDGIRVTDSDVLIHWVYGLDFKEEFTEHQRHTVTDALWNLKERGWLEITTEMIYRGKQGLPPKRFNTVKVWIKNGRIYNNRTNHFTSFQEFFDST
jgi:hypothetical protein